MRIKKVSQTTTTQAQIVDGYSESKKDGYSCDYVNNLIESDADYIKFPDGTMICYGSNTGVDGSYRSITFPEEFARTPYFTATVSGITASYQLTAQFGNLTTTGVNVQVHYGSTQVGANGFHWIAIGKWK